MSVETHYRRALAADERLQNELLRVYGARLAADARYYRNHDDAGIREAKARKLEADDKLLRAMRREREGTLANPGKRRTKKAPPRRKVQPKKRNAARRRRNDYVVWLEHRDAAGKRQYVRRYVPGAGPGDPGNAELGARASGAARYGSRHAERIRRRLAEHSVVVASGTERAPASGREKKKARKAPQPRARRRR